MKKILTRRVFLKSSASVTAGLSLGTSIMYAKDKKRKPKIRFGVCTDSHYADRDPRGARNYREALDEMVECVEFMNDEKVEFLVELGDFKDQDDVPKEEDTLRYLDEIEDVFKKFKGDRYHVIGNHDLDSLSKKQFLSIARNSGISKKKKYYSFNEDGIHFVVLDANYKADGTDYDHGNFNWKKAHVPAKELEWLKEDLADTSKPVIVFTHQELSGKDHTMIRNAKEVRKVLEESGKVLAVFQGHNHEGHYGQLKGIHYYTLKPMIEGKGKNKNSYAVVEVFADKSIEITGYGKALSRNISLK